MGEGQSGNGGKPRRRKRRGGKRPKSGTRSGTGAAPGAEGVQPKSEGTPAQSRPDRPRARWARETSAGGVVYRRAGQDETEIEVVLAARRTRRGTLAWGLAKGGIEPDESPEEAAIREVREETGLIAEIEATLGETKYFYVWEDVRIRKTVHFFLMRWTGGNPADHDDEMEDVRWFPLGRALKRAAYRGERDVLARAAELLQ